MLTDHLTRLSQKNFGSLAVCLLKEPIIVDGKILKGLIILSHREEDTELLEFLKEYFLIIERRGWYNINFSEIADIKLIENGALLDKTKRIFPNCILLDLSDADFVNTDTFIPLGNQKMYSGIQIANWMKFKRHELFMEGVKLLPDHKFIKFGNYVNNDGLSEYSFKSSLIDKYRDLKNVHFPFANAISNKELPFNAKRINAFINMAKIGIMTSSEEGINRFKTECMSANIPFLIASDANYPLKKHLNEQTGMLFDPTPEGLSDAIRNVLYNYNSFSPREYIIRYSGLNRSLNQLKEAVKRLCHQENQPYRFDEIYYDGRNETLSWGNQAINLLIHTLINLTK